MTSYASIPVRELNFCRKNELKKRRLIIRITGPYLLEAEKVNFRFDEGSAGCIIEFDGLNENNIEVFGVDSLHALSLAIDVDPYLRGMSATYDFYWLDGAPYFDG